MSRAPAPSTSKATQVNAQVGPAKGAPTCDHARDVSVPVADGLAVNATELETESEPEITRRGCGNPDPLGRLGRMLGRRLVAGVFLRRLRARERPALPLTCTHMVP